MKLVPIALVAVATLAASKAEAATLIYDLYSGSSTTATNSGSGYGNVRTFTVGAVTVTVTAWGLTGNSETTFQTAQLGRFDTGLGSCNRSSGEQTGCGSPQHQVDNSGADDFVLFQFSKLVDPVSVTINPYGSRDRDVSYWVGNVASNLNLTGYAVSGLGGLGFGARTDDSSTASDDPRTVSIGGGQVNSLLFAGKVGDYDDYFKIASLALEIPEETRDIPEPAAMTLLVASLLGLATRRRASAG